MFVLPKKLSAGCSRRDWRRCGACGREPEHVGGDELGDAAEHVAENMIAGGHEFAAVVVPLDDGNSSSQAGSQAVDDSEDEVASAFGVHNMMQRLVRALRV